MQGKTSLYMDSQSSRPFQLDIPGLQYLCVYIHVQILSLITSSIYSAFTCTTITYKSIPSNLRTVAPLLKKADQRKRSRPTLPMFALTKYKVANTLQVCMIVWIYMTLS